MDWHFQFAFQFVEPILAPSGQDQLVAGLGVAARAGLAETGRGAGDEDRLAHLGSLLVLETCAGGSETLASCHNRSISSKWAWAGVRPFSARRPSIWRKRRSNLPLAWRKAASGSIFKCRARLAMANSRSPISS